MSFPTGSPNTNNVRIGGVGYLLIKEVDSAGADLETPDTWHNLGFVGPVKSSRKPTTDSSKVVTAKTNAAFQEITALAAYDAATATATSAPDMELSWDLKESSLEHLGVYDDVKGKYFILCLPVGQRGAKWVDNFYFVKIDDGGDENYDGDKETSLTMKAKVQTNNVAITAMTAPTDDNVKATAFTIAQYKGMVRVGTT
jgi:hypothetical protein